MSPIRLQFPGVLIFVLAGALGVLAASPAAGVAPLRIMPLGDSITAGYTDNPTWNVPFGFGYRSGLSTRLTDGSYYFQFVGNSPEPWNGVFGVPKYVSSPDLRPLDQDHHRGYGGWGVDEIYNNIDNWLNDDDPDVILLMIGINNIAEYSTGNPTTLEGKLNNLVNKIVTRKPDAHLIVAQITPYAGYTGQIVNYNSYIKNAMVPYYASHGKNVTTVDQYSNFLTPGGAIDTSLYSNGINHPNALGYDRMAQTWYEGIQAVVVPEPSTLVFLAMGLFSAAIYFRCRRSLETTEMQTPTFSYPSGRAVHPDCWMPG
ncbi:MAG: PEP-CTERM sorting domain-containing protein [Pirellulales bacterium]|nr:PEP-CTERM sorting domain-containing protein [Pirellulales bacterium]